MFQLEDALKNTCPHCGGDMSQENARYMGRCCPRCDQEIDFGEAIHELRKKHARLQSGRPSIAPGRSVGIDSRIHEGDRQPIRAPAVSRLSAPVKKGWLGGRGRGEVR